MKFKIIESNDYNYDLKDKNTISHAKWYAMKRDVLKNPKRITFDPFIKEMQDLHNFWLMERREKIVLRILFTLLFVALCLACYELYLEGINV